MAFELVSGLAAKDFVLDLKLCRVLFEDNKYYPWIFCADEGKYQKYDQFNHG